MFLNVLMTVHSDKSIPEIRRKTKKKRVVDFFL